MFETSDKLCKILLTEIEEILREDKNRLYWTFPEKAYFNKEVWLE